MSLNISKHANFFNPITDLKGAIHIIGCGAIGSTVAEMLTRMGIEKIHLYDFDVVTAHNLANQMFYHNQINTPKINALTIMLNMINPELEIVLHEEGYVDQNLSGFVFLCVDNIDLRRSICELHKDNPNIKAIFDFRMRLTDAQHYAADWQDQKSRDNLLGTMQFSHAEAKKATPTNACGTTMNIITTVRIIVSLGLCNFINFIKTGELKKMVLADGNHFNLDAF